MSDSYSLFSGGNDSLVATHYSMSRGYTDEVLYLDTGTGLEENKEYIKEVCENREWPLRVEETPVDYKEKVLEYGFPNPSQHSWYYRYLKERQLGKIATECDEKPHFYTGVRKSESRRRMKNVDSEVKETDRWFWHSPISDFTEEDCDEYIEEYDLSRSEIVKNIHRSGDCFCGAFAHRDEELIDLEAHYPEHYRWIKSVEDEVQDERGGEEKGSYWGNGSMSESDFIHMKNSEIDSMLCQECHDSMYDDILKFDWGDDYE